MAEVIIAFIVGFAAGMYVTTQIDNKISK